ncbi:MAG TPA: metalloregulator ArsR/SmtB family transcription factor [Candidatus Nanopelagicaceae bacterium]|nr:metalloregulator ArsR/SmtB family transcription factor [Candidatus Nanopelagicaceae bacterium]
MTATPDPSPLDRSALRALAHPIRLHLLEVLRRRGPLMVSDLAEAVGESVASASYHLGQLRTHGYIQARTDLARSGRERWWQASEEAAPRNPEDETGLNRLDTLLAGMQMAQLQGYLAERSEKWSAGWREAATVGSYRLRLTPSQLSTFHEEFVELYRRYRAEPPTPDKDAEELSEVTLTFNAVPQRNEQT